MKRTVLSLGLALALIVQMLPVNIWAVEMAPIQSPQVVEDASTQAVPSTPDTAEMDGTTLANYNSLMQQLTTEGISMSSTGSTSYPGVTLQSHYVDTKFTATTDYYYLGTINEPFDDDATFDFDLVNGAFEGVNDATLFLGSYNGRSQEYKPGSTVSLSGMMTPISLTLEIPAYSEQESDELDGYSGNLVSQFRFSNGHNISFNQDGHTSASASFFVDYAKQYIFHDIENWSDWQTAVHSDESIFPTPLWTDRTDVYGTGYPNQWWIVSDNDRDTYWKMMEATATEIWGAGDERYQVDFNWLTFGDDSGAQIEVFQDTDTPTAILRNATPWPTGSTVYSYQTDFQLYDDTLAEVNPIAPYEYMGTDDPLAFQLNDWDTETIDPSLAKTVSAVVGPTLPNIWGFPEDMSYEYLYYPMAASGNEWPATVLNDNYDLWKWIHLHNYTWNRSFQIYDKTPPTVQDVTAKTGTYESGEWVPITLTFSEPVRPDDLTVTINNDTYTAEDLHLCSTGRTATVYYQVLDVDATSLVVSQVGGLKDLLGNTTALDNHDGMGWTATNVTLESVLMRNAVQGILVDPNNQTITLEVNQDSTYRTKYANYNAANGTAPFAIQLRNDKGETYGDPIPCTLEETSATTMSVTADLPDIPATDDAQHFTVQLFVYESTTDTVGTHLWWMESGYTVGKKLWVTSVSLSYPEDDTTTLSLSEAYRPNLSATFNPVDADDQSGTWSSSNTAIATIDQEGQVALTNTAVGKVYFTFTADSGTATALDDKTATSHTYTVVAGDALRLTIPNNAQHMLARLKKPTTVFWGSNASLMEGIGIFNYQVDVYQGRFDTTAAITGTPVYTSGLLSSTTSNWLIPENKLSTIGDYTVKVSIPATATMSEMSALAWVTVKAEQAGVTINPSQIYLLDTQTANIPWTIHNFVDATTTDATLTVKKVTGDNTATDFAVADLDQASGTYHFAPDTVTFGDLKDTYMFSMEGRNSESDAYDMDGFLLYVYRDGALQIQVDGQKVASLTMDNVNQVSGTLPTDTADILALREELALIEYVGINYEDYSWSQLKDGIQWDTSDQDVTTINYKQGGLYETIKNFNFDTYLPETELLLSSLTDGTATITATHANTGMTDSLTVNVDTLRNRLYLFQVSPMLATTLTYTTNGQVKTATTNDQGYLALYVPDGIDSDVTLRSEDSHGRVYLGTIYHKDLTSGERDATKLQLYPINQVKLRQVAQQNLYLTNPNGSPFVGTLTLRGGVYVDGGYCQDALLQGNGNTNLQSGRIDQTVVIPDGYLTVNYDSTQFWSSDLGQTRVDALSLSAQNKIEYILELSDLKTTAGTEYYPQIVKANAALSLDEIMYTSSNVLTLEDATGQVNRAFIADQTLQYDGLGAQYALDVSDFTGHLGPNANFNSATLTTTALIWGEGLDVFKTQNYDISLVNGDNAEPSAGHSSADGTYPFSSMGILTSTMVLNTANLAADSWAQDMKSTPVRILITRGDDLMKSQSMPFRIIDMTKVEDVMASATTSTMVDELFSGSTLGSAETGNAGNAILSTLLDTITPIMGDVGGSPFNIVITPTADNAVFNCLIWGGYDGMGLDDADYNENGLALDYSTMEVSAGIAGVSDLVGMATKDPSDNPGATPGATGNTDASGGSSGGGGNPGDVGGSAGSTSSDTNTWSKAPNFSGQLEGSYEGEIVYNFDTGKWEMHVLNGGFTAGFQGAMTFTASTMIYCVPVFVDLEVGGMVQLDFKVGTRYQEMPGYEWASTVDTATVQEYLTKLRLMASVGVFGGIGFDMSVLSVKVGPFGELAVDNSNLFLTRNYLANSALRDVDGQHVSIDGEVGVKLAAGLGPLTLDVVFASGSAGYAWDKGAADLQSYWDAASSYGTGQGGLSPLSANVADMAPPTQTTVTSISLQDRDYLSRESAWLDSYGRSAMMTRSIDPVNGLFDLQDNANPSTYPALSDDGYHLLYVSDQSSHSVYDARVFATTNSLSGYAEGGALPDPTGFTGYGDSDVTLSGDSNFAAASWVRFADPIEGKDAGDDITLDDQLLLINGAEVVASIYENGSWHTTRLTDNATPDLAPVIATNDNGQAIAVWRSVYSGDANNFLNFSAQNHILYATYENGVWNQAKPLYNGSTGAVMGLDAQMLDNGTTLVTYSLDRDTSDGTAHDYEIAYSLVENGAVSYATVVTNDGYMDENPQVVVAGFDGATADQRFVLGWYSDRENGGDIRLLAVDEEGVVSNNFPESLAQMTNANNTKLSNNFHFARMNAGYNALENLTLLWVDAVTDSDGAVDHSLLKGTSFRMDGAKEISLTAALNVAELEKNTMLDHFDAYVSNDNQVKAVLQGTFYDPGRTVRVNGYTLPQETTKLYTATQDFGNNFEVQRAMADYQSLSLNSLNAVQFSLFNAGVDDITKAVIQIGDETFENALTLAPNNSQACTCWYPVGNAVTDPNYTVTVTFENRESKTVEGTIFMDYPDVGISQMKVAGEQDGLRTLRITLYNASVATLAGNKGRTVRLAFYDGAHPDLSTIQTVAYKGTDGAIGWDASNQMLTITGEQALTAIDNGVCTFEVTYNVKDYVETSLAQTEIPKTGVRLYAVADVVEAYDDTTILLSELNTNNNSASVLFESLLTRTEETVTMDITQTNQATTSADITLRNNSLQTQTGGGMMIASLLDETGVAVEQQQVSFGANTLSGESIQTRTVVFDQMGNSVTTVYGTLETGSNTLAALNIGGINIQASDFTENWTNYYTYILPSLTSGDYPISIAPTDPNATVTLTVNGTDCPLTGNSATVTLPNGRAQLSVKINNTTEYDISLYTDASPITITLVAGDHGTISGNSATVLEGTKWGNAVFQVTVTPDEGYVLDGWYMDGAKLININDTLNQATTLTAKFVEQSKEEIIRFSTNPELMPDYLTVTPFNSDMTARVYEDAWNIAYEKDAVFTLEVDAGARYYVNSIQYQSSGKTHTIDIDAEGKFTLPWSVIAVGSMSSIWANTTQYYTVTFKADNHSTLADTTYYSDGINLYKTYYDMMENRNPISTIPLPVVDTGYRLAADTTAEPQWTDANGNGYTSAELLDTYWSKSLELTVNTLPSSNKTWSIQFRSDGNGTVSTNANGSYKDGTILYVPTPIPDKGYMLPYDGLWTDKNHTTVELGTTVMATGNQVYTAHFVPFVSHLDFPDSPDWLYDVQNSKGESIYAGTYGTDFQFKLIATPGTTIPDYLVYSIGGIEKPLTPDSNGFYTIPGDELLDRISITQGTPAVVDAIAIGSTTHKTTYTRGDRLDVTDLTLTVTMDDGTTQTVAVTDTMVTGFDSSMVTPAQTLTITYGEKTITYTIAIQAPTTGGSSGGSSGGGTTKPLPITFSDVSKTAYYYDAVLWAVREGVTQGYGDGTFRPEVSCTRSQAVTFLWNAAGKPTVQDTNPFQDVSEDAWYYDAILWAVAEGITKGTSDTTFSPDAICTRSQIVTFLWNAAGKPMESDATSFEDVSSNTWYSHAVRWAAAEQITSGYSATIFAPSDNCTRSQIVTFLYRNLGDSI